MNPVTEQQIRTSFVNCSRREAAQLTLPTELADLRWERLDYLGWIDRRAPEDACRLLDGLEDGDINAVLHVTC